MDKEGVEKGGRSSKKLMGLVMVTMMVAIIVFSLFLMVTTTVLSRSSQVAAAAEDEKIPVIILLKDQYKPTPQDRLLSREAWVQSMKSFTEDKQRDLLTELRKDNRVKDVKQFWIVNAISCKATTEVIEEIKKRPDVAKVELDRKVYLLDADNKEKEQRFFKFKTFNSSQTIEQIHPGEGEEIAWGVDWIEAPQVWANGINGSGINVSVVDTGINASHPDLQGKVIAWKDFVNNKTTPYDDNGHGTHCAGTIAGTGAGGTKTGVAPGANLFGVKVFNSGGYANESDVMEGFQWSVANGADVISYSGGMLPLDGIEDEASVNASETNTHVIHVNDSYAELMDSFKPAFICAYVESPDLQNLSISLVAPNGTEVQGDYMDWLVPPDLYGEYIWLYKYSEDNPLPSGNWSLNVTAKGISVFSYDFNLSGVSNATLNFWTRYDTGDGSDNNGYLEISTDGGMNWTELARYKGYLSELTPGSIDLSNYTGKNVTVRFREITDSPVVDNPGWFIDNITNPKTGSCVELEGGAYKWRSTGQATDSGAINYSYGLLVAYPDNGTSAEAQEINNIAGLGVVPVIAAGNDGGFGLRTIASPGSASDAITVGATDCEMDYIAWFSSRGPVGYGANETIKPDVVAPGVGIVSTCYEGGYAWMSGTSMATPHVAGTVALMLQANSSLSPAEVKQILKNSSFDLGKEGEDNTYGAGRVDAYAAVSNVTELEPIPKVQLYAGCARYLYIPNQPVTITAISWNGTAVSGTDVRFVAEHYNYTSENYEEVLNTTNTTNEMGLATASFVPASGGGYDITISDEFGNVVHDWIWVGQPSKPEERPFDTPYQSYVAMPNTTVQMKYTLVTPDFKPYTESVNLTIKHWEDTVINVSLTPVNGTIAYDLNLSEYDFDDDGYWVGSIYIRNETESIEAGYLYIDPEGYTSELYPWYVRASPGDTITYLFQSYNYINNSPAPDREYTVHVYWFKEVEVKSLAETNFELTNKLMCSERMTKEEETKLFDKIKDIGINYTSFNVTTTNGIGTFDVSVPEDVYVGTVEVEGEYLWSSISVDLTPWMHHKAVPSYREDAELWIRADWDGEYDDVNRTVTPYDNFTVYVKLFNSTGSIQNAEVYLYAADEAKTVVTDAKGRANTTFSVSYNASLPREWNKMQVVGLYDGTWGYYYAYPPHYYIRSDIDANVKDNILDITVQHKNHHGELIDAPSILDVNEGSYEESTGTPLSKYIKGTEHHESLNVGPGDYLIRDIWKIPEGWGWYGEYEYIANTPLEILTPIYDEYLMDTTVPIEVHMKGDEANTTVYIFEMGSSGEYYYEGYNYYEGGEFQYVDVATTDANGNATLYLKVPSKGYVDYIIGGSNTSYAFHAEYGMFKVTEEAKPDLVPEIDIPELILPGESAFNVTVYNRGTLESNETTMNVYVDDSLVETTNMPAIGVGAYETFLYTYNFAEGSHTIKAVVDPDNLNDELNEDNNVSETNVVAAAKPDLIGHIEVPEYIKKYKNDTVAVSASFVIENIGTAAATHSFAARATYSGTSADLTIEDTIGAGENITYRINAIVGPDGPEEPLVTIDGYNYTVEANGNISLGDYTLGIYVDANNEIDELNETNNNATVTATVTRPDLVPMLTVPEGEVAPGKYNITACVRNKGHVYAVPTQLMVVIKNASESEVYNQSFNVPELDAVGGENSTWKKNVTFNFVGGVYNVSVIANSNDSEAETEYANNVITKKVTAVQLAPINATVSNCYSVPYGETRNSSIVLENINSTHPLGSLYLVLSYDPRVAKEAGNYSDYAPNVTMTTHHLRYNKDEVWINGSGLNLNGTVTIANITFRAVDDRGRSTPLHLSGWLKSVEGFNIPMNATDGVFTTVKITDLRPQIYCYPRMIAGTNNTINVYVRNLRHTQSDNFSLNVSVFNATSGDFVAELLNETYPGIPRYGGRMIPIVWNASVPEGAYRINATLYNDTITWNNNASRRVSVEEYKLDAHRIYYPPWKVRQNTTFWVGGYFRASHPGYVNASIELPEGLVLVSGETQNKTRYAWRSNWNSVWWRVKGITPGEYGNKTDKMINITVEAMGKSDKITTNESPHYKLKIWVPSIWVYSSNTTSLQPNENESNMTFKTLNVTTIDQKIKLVVQAGADGRRLSGLDYLVHYPYGCVEQVTSRMLGALHTDEYYRERGHPSGYNWDKVNTTIEMGVANLAKGGIRGQHDNGSWSMWGHRPRGDGFYSMYGSYGLGRVANDTLYGHLVTENLTSKHSKSAAPGKFNFNDTIYWFNQTAHEGTDGSVYWTPWQGTHWFFKGHLPVTSWTMVSHYEMVNYCGVNASAKSVANETMKKVTKYLVDSQREDGGWNQWGDNGSRKSDAISTALSVWGLKLYGMPSDNVSKTEIENAIANGSAWLIENQQGDGHWANPLESPWWNDYGRRSEATAYALIALNESKSMANLNFESLNSTNESVARGVGYLISTYRHHGSWGYTASTQAALHALTILQATSTVNTNVTIDIDGVVTKTVPVNGTCPRVEVSLNDTEIGWVNNNGTQDPDFAKKRIHTVNITRTDDNGTVIVSVENDQLVPESELATGDVSGHRILSLSGDGINAMSRGIKGAEGKRSSRTTMILTSLDEVMGDGGSSGTITVEPELPDGAVEGEMYLLNVTIRNNNDSALLSPIVKVPLGSMNFTDTEPDNETYADSGLGKEVIEHEYDATNNTLLIFPEEIPPDGAITVYFNATLPSGNLTFEAQVTPMYNELMTFVGSTTKYVKGYGNVTVNVYNESGLTVTDATVKIGADTTTAGAEIKKIEGSYSLNITKEGYVPVNATIKIERDDKKNVTVKLYREADLAVPQVIFSEGDLDTLNTTAAMTVNETVTPNAAIKAARDFTMNITSGGKTILAVKVPEYTRGSLSAPLDENIVVTNATSYEIDNGTMYIDVDGSKDVQVKFEGRKLGDVYKDDEIGLLDAVAILRYSIEKDPDYSIPPDQRWIETTDLWGIYKAYGDVYKDDEIGLLDAVAILRYSIEKDPDYSIPPDQRWIETTDLWG